MNKMSDGMVLNKKSTSTWYNIGQVLLQCVCSVFCCLCAVSFDFYYVRSIVLCCVAFGGWIRVFISWALPY